MRSAPFVRRVVPDTSVLVELVRDGGADQLIRRGWRLMTSAVVMSELYRGAHTRGERRIVDALARLAPCLAPDSSQWIRCGELLALVRRDHDHDERGLRDLQNDFLIGLTARGIGCPVATTNVRDFKLVAKYVRGLEVIEFP